MRKVVFKFNICCADVDIAPNATGWTSLECNRLRKLMDTRSLAFVPVVRDVETMSDVQLSETVVSASPMSSTSYSLDFDFD